MKPPRTPLRPASLYTGLLACALLLAGCATPHDAPSTAPLPWHTTTLGLCEDYPEETRSLAAARADLEEARRAGASVLRIAFGWDAMEPERGRYDWSFWDEFVRLATEDHRIRLIPYVCYTPAWAAKDAGTDHWRSPPRDPEDFARFMAAIVARYRHAISSWELWNEPDNRAYWLGSREEFAALVRAGSRAVRTTDPRATVVLGGIATETDFLEGLFANDRIAPAVDVVNLHSYFETWHPDTIETLPRYVDRASEIVRDHGENEPLWMAEVGYSSVGTRQPTSNVYHPAHDDEHTADAQAVALARTLVLALSTGRLPLVAWYRINDLPPVDEVIGDDNNRHLGIRSVDRGAKPAFPAFAQIARWFSEPYQIVTPLLSARSRGASTQLHAFRFGDGRVLVATWIGAPESRPVSDTPDQARTPPRPDRREAALRLDVPIPKVSLVRVTDACGNALSAQVRWHGRRGATRLEFELSGSELLFMELQP